MQIIIGLGNPSGKYSGTRHNTGFEVIDCLAKDSGIEINRVKHRAHIGEGFIAGNKVLLLKPQTYMNLSGESVCDVLRFYKLTPEDIIVIYDDASLDAGQIRIRKSGSAGGHNGIKNIIERLDTDVFLRVKVGIGEKPDGWDLSDYVLSKFKKDEEEAISDSIQRAAAAVELIISQDVTAAMNKYNPRERKKSELD